MPRLIDADALTEKAYWHGEHPDVGNPFAEGVEAVDMSDIDNVPTIEAVPLDEIYRVIAGHSDYHGENILAALTCIAEGKTVNPVKPLEAEAGRHGRCPICNGEKPMLQDCDNGVSIEVDAYQMEMTVWMGDECLAVFSIDYCPNCGAKMDGDSHEP